MASVLFGVFLLLHGFVHALWLVPAPDDPKWPFVTSRSRLLPSLPRRVLSALAVALVVSIIVGFALAALGLFGVPGLSRYWGTAAVTASALSLVACAVFWDRQLIWGPLIDIAIIAAVVMGWPNAG